MSLLAPAGSSTRPSLLDTILGELPRSVFLADYLGKKFLPLPGVSTRFEHLLTWNDINRILETHVFSAGTLRMKKAGLDVPVDSYLTEYQRHARGTSGTRISARVITKELREGATLIINEIQMPWAPIQRLVEDLEEVTDARVNVNMYAALHESHAFGCHYDMHDVLVLQVEGRKHWQVFDRRPMTPFADEPFNRSERPQVATPIWDEILTQGDALYLPRGFWHFAEPIGESSVHLSVGIVSPTGRDLLSWLVQDLSSAELLRRNLPQFVDAVARNEFLDALRLQMTQALSRPDLLDRFLRDRGISDGSIPWRHFSLPSSATSDLLPPSDDAVIHLSAAHALRTYDSTEAPDSIVLFQEGRQSLTFRKRTATLCDYLMREAPVPVRSFLDKFRNDFAEPTLREFLKQLATEHLIAVKSPISTQLTLDGREGI